MLLAKATLTALMLWASQLSGLAVMDNQLPTVEYSYGLSDTTGAVTHVRSGNIEVNANVKWTPREFTCTVVHELVHYLQFRHGLLPAPNSAVEPPAYEAAALCAWAYGDRASYHWAMWQAEAHRAP